MPNLRLNWPKRPAGFVAGWHVSLTADNGTTMIYAHKTLKEGLKIFSSSCNMVIKDRSVNESTMPQLLYANLIGRLKYSREL